MVFGKNKKTKKEKEADAAVEEQPVEEQKADATEESAEQSSSETKEDKEKTPEETIEELQQKVSELQDRFIRSKAELDNFRKRAQREYGEIRQNTKSSTIMEFFSIFDHFQMAIDHAEQNSDFNTLKQGMDMILGEMKRTFEALGVTPMSTIGEEFDPNLHEAVAQEASENVPEGNIIRQWKCGYKMGDRLLRPAAVVVSSGKAEEAEQDNKDEPVETEAE